MTGQTWHRSPEEMGRVKVMGCCAACHKPLCRFLVQPDGSMVAVGRLSLFNDGGITDTGDGAYLFRCTRKRCEAEPFTMSDEEVVTLAKAAATSGSKWIYLPG